VSEFAPDYLGKSPVGEQSTSLAQLADVSDRDFELALRVFSAAAQSPQRITQLVMPYIVSAIEVSNLLIPISQIFGFTGYTANLAEVTTLETTTSTAYTDLATTGPTLTLGPGMYVVLVNAAMNNNTGTEQSFMSHSANGAAAADANAARVGLSAGVTVASMAVSLVTLTGGTNTITAKYRSTNAAATATFLNRRIAAIKYANA